MELFVGPCNLIFQIIPHIKEVAISISMCFTFVFSVVFTVSLVACTGVCMELVYDYEGTTDAIVCMNSGRERSTDTIFGLCICRHLDKARETKIVV